MKQFIVFSAVLLWAFFSGNSTFGQDSDVKSAKEQAIPRLGTGKISASVMCEGDWEEPT